MEELKDANIKERSIFGMIWKVLERFAAKAVSLVVSIVLARLLTPDDYSIVGIVSIFFVFANILISGGFNTALIQKKEVDVVDYSSVLFLNTLIAIVIYAIIFVCAPFIATIYKQPILTPVFRIMGLTLFINAFKSILCANVSRSLLFKKFFFATIGGTLASAVVGITMAVRGFGPWALVAQQMTNSLIDTIILVFTTKFRVVFKVSFQKLGVLFKYGWKIFISSVISAVYDEINPLAIGLKYSGADLAFYSKGNSFPSLIYRTLGESISSVYFPVLSKYQDDKKKMLNVTRKFISISSFIMFPTMIGFLFVADNFVEVILTSTWAPATIYIQMFCIVYMLNVINIANVQVIQATGRSDVLLKIEVLKKIIYFTVIILFLLFTHTPELLGLACIINAVIAIGINTFVNKTLIGYQYKFQIIDMVPNLLSALMMGVVVYFVGKVTINKIILLALQVVSGVVSYLLICLTTNNTCLKYCFETVKKIFKKKRNNKLVGNSK